MWALRRSRKAAGLVLGDNDFTAAGNDWVHERPDQKQSFPTYGYELYDTEE